MGAEAALAPEPPEGARAHEVPPARQDEGEEAAAPIAIAEERPA